MTLQEVQAIFTDLAAGRIIIKGIEKRGNAYVLPIGILNAIFANSEGTIDKVGPWNRRGEVLLPAESLAIAGTTPVLTSEFETKGYKNLLVTIINPTWVTNPTAIAMTQNFYYNGQFFNLYVALSAVSQNVNVADATQRCYFLHQITATNMVKPLPFPNEDENQKIALVFTPAGTAESKDIIVTVFGVG